MFPQGVFYGLSVAFFFKMYYHEIRAKNELYFINNEFIK